MTSIKRQLPNPYEPWDNNPTGDGSGDTNITLVQPWMDPPNTFRAADISEVFYITPAILEKDYWTIENDTIVFEYDIGTFSTERNVIFTFQNLTISNNLLINIILPPYMHIVPNEAGIRFPSTFIVPYRGNIITPPSRIEAPLLKPENYALGGNPVTERWSEDRVSELENYQDWIDPNTRQKVRRWRGSGRGRINVDIGFNEEAADLLPAGISTGKMMFLIKILDLDGPVYVDMLAEYAKDLNPILDENPDNPPRRDDDPLPPPEEAEPEVVTEPVVVEVEVPFEVTKEAYVDGTDGELKDGPAPAGWYAGADGRMYPPIIEDPCNKQTTGFERSETPCDIDPAERTELENLLCESERIAPVWGSNERRRGYAIDPLPFITGPDTQAIARRVLPNVVGASNLEDIGFVILNYSDEWPDGEPVPPPPSFVDPTATDPDFARYITDVNRVVGYVKLGLNVPGFGSRTAFIGAITQQMIRGTVYDTSNFVVERDGNPDLELTYWILRAAATAASIITSMRETGEGKSVT